MLESFRENVLKQLLLKLKSDRFFSLLKATPIQTIKWKNPLPADSFSK